jgi:hypothetical protein
MKILLLGKNGQVGWELQRALARWARWWRWTSTAPASVPNCGRLLASPTGLAALVRAVRPDVIVNAAAHTAVDKAESEPELAAPSTPRRRACWPAKPPSWAPGWCTTAPTMCLTAAATSPARETRRHRRR